MKKNKFDIPFLSYKAIEDITHVSTDKMYKYKTIEDFNEKDKESLLRLRTIMKEVQEKFKL